MSAADYAADALASTPPLPERFEDASRSARQFAEHTARRRGVDVSLVWSEFVAEDRAARASAVERQAGADVVDAIIAGARASSGTALRPAHG